MFEPKLICATPLTRPGWTRTVETSGRGVLLRIINSEGVEVNRYFFRESELPTIRDAIRRARATEPGVDKRRVAVVYRTRNYITIDAATDRGATKLIIQLHDREGTPLGKYNSLSELDAIEQAIDSVSSKEIA